VPHSRNKFGLALGGGGARGFAHIGVMRVLEHEGLKPSLIAGTSMGGLLGALFAAGCSSGTAEKFVQEASLGRLLDLNPLKDMLRLSELKKMLGVYLPKTFEELPTRLCLTATDLITGRGVYLHQGDLLEAIGCTIAFPGAIDATWVGETLLADGGLLNQVPVDAVRFLGANRVLAVDVTPLAPLESSLEDKPIRWWEHLLGRDRRMTGMQTMMRSLEIMQFQMTETRLAMFVPDLILRPKLDGIGLFSFNREKDAIKAGEEVARLQLEHLRSKFK
jgi:NTE family protein